MINKSNCRLLLVSLCATLCLAINLRAASFSNAASNALSANTQASLAMYYGLLSLQADSAILAYYAYIYMDASQEKSLEAYQNAAAAYSAAQTTNGYYAQLYSYYDWYYKWLTATNLFYTYVYGDPTYSSNAITYGYYALLYSGYTSYFCGLASVGGAR
jgi:hypothetical protein